MIIGNRYTQSSESICPNIY